MMHRGLSLVGLALLLVAISFPLVCALVASMAPESRLFDGSLSWPGRPVWDHYRALFAERDFLLPIRNSLVVAGTTTVLCVGLGAFCAYAIARLRFRGQRLVLGFLLVVTMFPQISIVSPLYLVLRKLQLIDTFPGLVLPYLTFAMPLTVWILVGFFRQLPVEIEEAALVDGASRMRVLFSIVLPLSAPALATASILTFIYCWNEFLFALSFTLGPDHHTVPVAIALFRGRYQLPWGEILAGAVVATAPVVLLVLGFQKRIVRGLVSGAVKG